MTEVHKLKYRGMKRKVIFLEDNNVIQQGDIQYFEMSKEDILENNGLINNGNEATTSVGDIVSNYPRRLFLRILDF